MVGEGLGLVGFCFLMQSPDHRDEEMRTIYQCIFPGVIDRRVGLSVFYKLLGNIEVRGFVDVT